MLKRKFYCVVLSRDKERAFQSEAENSEKVFEDICNKILDYERRKNL